MTAASWGAVLLCLVPAACVAAVALLGTGCNPTDSLLGVPLNTGVSASSGGGSSADFEKVSRPAVPSTPARAAYFYWGWTENEADFDGFVPLLVGHYTSMCVVFVGGAARIQAQVDHLLSIPHPDLIVGLTTADLLTSLEDGAGWQELGSLAAWCVGRTGIRRIGLDVEWSLDGYLYKGASLDLAKYEDGLRKFAAYIPGVHVYFYPPNWEASATEANMRTVLQRSRIISAGAKYLPNFHAIGASISTYDEYRANPFGQQYRDLEALWSVSPGAVEQIFVIDDTWWAPDQLRPILRTIPRECWLYVEPPYDAAKADRLIRCLEAPLG